jgi:hypothetical protein
MTRAELYKLWAPDDSIWTQWAKPVLFADSSFDSLPLSDPPGWRMLNLSWAPSSTNGTAIVADLPGLESIKVGTALGHAGFRPVPLFNGTAGPMMGTMSGAFPLVDVIPIIRALHAVAEDLMTLRLPPNAPPVFLLDANRFHGGNVANPGRFDNRWWVFPQDLPSANFLLSQNIRSVLLVQEHSAQPQRDLAHVLLRWQEAGIQMLSCGVSDEHPPAAIRVEKPNNFRALWYRAMVLAGLRRNSAGGFGAVIPVPGSGGGYG